MSVHASSAFIIQTPYTVNMTNHPGVEIEVEQNRQNIRSDGYAMSIGEVLNLYKDREIVIRPEFQRLFRWPIEKQSRLIESMLLDIPLPPIFVSQAEDSVWEVVDGLQRLSTILKFMGELRNEETGEMHTPSTLTKTKYIPSLDGMQYSDLPQAVKIQLKRARLDFRILLKESDDAVKYELFDRLNSGGMRTSPQEVRTALLIMSNPGLFTSLQSLRSDANVADSLALSDRQLEEQYDLELLVRFIVFRTSTPDELGSFADIDSFLTDKLLALAKDDTFDPGDMFNLTLRIFAVANTIGSAAFRRFDAERGRSTGGFSVSAFEAVTAGLALHIDDWEALDPSSRSDELYKALGKLWVDPDFRSNSGAGVRASSRAPRMPAVGHRLFQLS